jgi:hypothetical protein
VFCPCVCGDKTEDERANLQRRKGMMIDEVRGRVTEMRKKTEEMRGYL